MLIVATGLAVLIGVLLGMLGRGGSVLMMPALLYMLALEPKPTLATPQIILTLTSIAALTAHARAGRVVWKAAGVFGLTGMLGAYLGGRTAEHVPARALLLGFAVLMVASAVQMLRGRNQKGAEPAHSASRPRSLGRSAAAGLCTGFVAGMLGADAGFLIVMVLLLFGGLPMPQAVGASLLIIFMQSFASSAGYLGQATIEGKLAALLGGTMAVASIGGSSLSQRLPAATLRNLFAGLLIGIAILMSVRVIW